MASAQETATAKIKRRLLPFLLICYLFAYLDRTNVGIAALTMNKDLGLSPTMYAWGGGIFFLGYFLFEVPSNYFLEKIGARIWIARIMITWGLIASLAAVIWNDQSFYWVRFLLGAGEAGFLPGIVLYLSRWFPARERGVIISTFFLGIPLSSVLGAPLSGALLQLDGVWGMAGWRLRDPLIFSKRFQRVIRICFPKVQSIDLVSEVREPRLSETSRMRTTGQSQCSSLPSHRIG